MIDNVSIGEDYKDLLDSVTKFRKNAKDFIEKNLTVDVKSAMNPEHLKIIEKTKNVNNMSSDSLQGHLKDLQNLSKQLDPKNNI